MSTIGTGSIEQQQQRQKGLGTDHDSEYSAFLAHVKATFKKAVADPDSRLFYVSFDPADAPGPTDDEDDSPLSLFDHYLAHIPRSQRQVHNCSTCRSFMKRYGGLVTVSKKGGIRSALWNEDGYEGRYEDAITGLRQEVESASIKGVFLAKEINLGHAITGGAYFNEPEWSHLAVQMPRHMIFSSSILSAKQKMAVKREDYKNMVNALSEFSVDIVNQAVTLLESEALYRSDAVLGPAKFLQEVMLERAGVNNRQFRANLLWKRVASAPDGFLHPKSSMIGTLLEDLQKGMKFDVVKKRFADKMAPTQYMRPQVAPKAGNIQQAETIIAKLNAAGALDRRFARLDEIQTIWQPQRMVSKRSSAADEGGVFSHLQSKGASPSADLKPMQGMQPKTMTWSLFRSKVLPDAIRIQVYTQARGLYGAYTTAAFEDAEPIIQWDHPEQRNPVAWYVYPNGSTAHQWGLAANTWVDILGMSLQPHQWFHESQFTHQGQGVLFVLPKCLDSAYKSAGNALFPQCLRSELHGVRATVEAYSRTAVLSGADEPNLACGIKFSKENDLRGMLLRVQKKDGTVMSYALDRWE